MSLAKYVTVENNVIRTCFTSTKTAGIRVSGPPSQLCVYWGLWAARVPGPANQRIHYTWIWHLASRHLVAHTTDRKLIQLGQHGTNIRSSGTTSQIWVYQWLQADGLWPPHIQGPAGQRNHYIWLWTWPAGTWVPTLHTDNPFYGDIVGQMLPGYLQYPSKLVWMNPYSIVSRIH